ncbi:AAA family ATPase [Fulvivirga sp. M361]|uniref:deoxynucleoside kinase n=1 Tax=Fulvivirga sp. M361 TaxID=2594266 RepID=UPI00117ADEED|nr:deoxynucleoside kinase [Fulvivirga sp. M361]TRX59496.1 AAA family ATPase [Fulvivirga sp. M361]
MHIAICGNIGSGKTTLAKLLAKQYNWHAELESVEENPYLADFYEDMQRWSFHLQVYFLNSRFRQVKNIRSSKVSTVQDRTIYEDAYIFAANLKSSDLMNARDYACYQTLFESMIEHVTPPDLLVYLKADIPKLVSQIEKRGREYENAIRLDYLKNLNQHYTNWISSYDLGKHLVIDVNQLDFVNNIEDRSLVIQRIDAEINGLFS